MDALLRRIQDKVEALRKSRMDFDLLQLAYVDDLAILVRTHNPHELVRLLQRILYICHQEAAVFGLKLFFGEGKTEAMVKLVGDGSDVANVNM
eukprot:9593602-Prorocentrum_lima.AAC.1